MDRKSQGRTLFFNRFFTALAVLGGLIAVIGLGLDLLPGSRPGISVPQMMMILGGFVFAGLSFILRKAHRRQRIRGNIVHNLLITVVVIIVTIVVLELVLTAANVPIRYSPELRAQTLERAPYWVCDEIGCRYDQAVVEEMCLAGTLSNIHCVINHAGFHDTQEFVTDEQLDEASLRVMALGDSFTFGASARLGYSWVEIVESNLPDLVLWNTGMPGTGTHQALEVLDTYAPIMEPDLIILGFYMNDFSDNLYPLDQFFRGSTANGKTAIIRQYKLHQDGTITKINDPLHLVYRLNGFEPPQNPVETFLGTTRLGTLLLNTSDTIHNITGKLNKQQFNQQIDITRDYLQKLQTYSDSLNSELFILLIPDKKTLTQSTPLYQSAIQLFDELEIPYLDPTDQLNLQTDYAPEPDIHWNTTGHGKIGMMVTECIEQFLASESLGDCETIVMP